MAKKVSTAEKKDFHSILSSFDRNLEDLFYFTTNLIPFLRELDKAALEKREKLKGILRGIPENQDIKSRKNISEEAIEGLSHTIISLLRDNVVWPWIDKDRMGLLFRTSFVMLLSYFDYLMSDIIYYYYKIYPNALSGTDLTISLVDLKQCPDREGAIDFILEKKVESVLYKNLNSQLLFLKNDLKTNVNKKIIEWEIINEAVERRNLLVHNDGIVNRRYLKNVKGLIADKEKKGLAVGDILTVEEGYFKQIYDGILLAGVILLDTCWRKWVRKEVDEATKCLDMSLVKLLVRKEWSIAERLGYYAKNIEVNNIYAKNDLIISYCVALKRLGKKRKVDKEIRGINKAGVTFIQRAQINLLEDDKDSFYLNVKKAAENKDVHIESLLRSFDWPALNEIRKDQDYKDKIDKAFSGLT
jgi:hypothetical protein